MRIIVFLLLYFKITLQDQAFTAGSRKWVDPHDMNVDIEYDYRTPETTTDSSQYNTVNYEPGPLKSQYSSSQTEDRTLEYLKRFLRLMMNSAQNSASGSSKLVGSYILHKESHDYQFLSKLLNQNSVAVEDLRKLDDILSRMFSSTTSEQILDSVLSFQEKFFNILFSRSTLLLIAIPVAIYIVYGLFKSNFSFFYILRYLLMMILIFDYGLRYNMLLEEAENHNMEIKYTSKCDTSLMTWTQWFKHVVDTETCKEKRIVNPLDVLLDQVKDLIVIPLSAIGTGMGSFGREIWTELGYPWNILIFPILLLFIILITAIILTASNNKLFKIKLFHLLHFEFGEPQQQQRPNPVELRIHLPVGNRTEENHQNQQIEDKKSEDQQEMLQIEDNATKNKQPKLQIEDIDSKTTNAVSSQSEMSSDPGERVLPNKMAVFTTKVATNAENETKNCSEPGNTTVGDSDSVETKQCPIKEKPSDKSSLECFDENSCSDYGSSSSSHCEQEYEIISDVDVSDSDKDKTVTYKEEGVSCD